MAKKAPTTSVVTDRGQVTIPCEIRKQLGIPTLGDPVSRVYGIAGKGRTGQIIRKLRGDE